MARTLRNTTDKIHPPTLFTNAPIPPAAKATGPLAAHRWAGAKYARRPPIMREQLETVICAIDDHRAGLIGDVELYAVLTALGINPSPRGPSDKARERARAKYTARKAK